MAGPMASLTSGNNSFTAWAIKWAVEWRKISSPSGSFSKIGSRVPSWDKARVKSIDSPFRRAATIFFKDPWPLFIKASRAVVALGRSRGFPSGNFI